MKLNQERYGTTFDLDRALDKLKEELQEFIDASETQYEYGQVDALNDIIIIATGELIKLGYNPELTLKQTVKEITSRQQDPAQAKRWVINDKQPGEKWLKNQNQPESTLYTADYSTCKLPSN